MTSTVAGSGTIDPPREPALGPALDPGSRAYLCAVRDVLTGSLGADLVACYVYGSVLTPEFVPARSDLDTLVVTRTWLSKATEQAVLEALRALRRPRTLKGLDIWFMPLAVSRAPRDVPRYQARMLTSLDFVRSDVPDRYGDPRLAMLLAICRNHSRALVGPPPTEVIGRVPLSGVLGGMLADLTSRAQPYYRVLNACRDQHFLETGRMCSKLEGAAWARGRAADADLVDTAVRWHVDGTGPPLDPQRVDALVATVAARLHRAVQDGQVPPGCAGWRDPDRPLRGGPKVACLMPTYNRRGFVERSIRLFQAQDYPNRQLVIIDDGEDEVADLAATDPRIRYERLSHRTSIGQKRNVAVEAADGDIVVQWDDDDWYGPARLSRQVAPLVADRADLTAIQKSWLVDLGDGRFFRRQVQPQRLADSLAAGTIAMTTALWRRLGGYPDASKREDRTMFLRALDAGARVEGVANDGVYVYVRHDGNSWRFVRTPTEQAWWAESPPPDFVPPGVFERS